MDLPSQSFALPTYRETPLPRRIPHRQAQSGPASPNLARICLAGSGGDQFQSFGLGQMEQLLQKGGCGPALLAACLEDADQNALCMCALCCDSDAVQTGLQPATSNR